MDQIKKIELGKFYTIHDGSKNGHPGLIVWKNDELNRYLVVKFDSDKKGEIPKKNRGVRHITELKHPISNNIIRSYVKNRPLLCKRRDIGTEYVGLRIMDEDKPLIDKVRNSNKQYSKSIKK